MTASRLRQRKRLFVQGMEGTLLSGRHQVRGDARLVRKRLPTVEINNTFYRTPTTTVLESWSAHARSLPVRDQGIAPHHAHRADQDGIGGRAAGYLYRNLARSAQSAVPCCSSCRRTSRRTCRASPFLELLPDDHRAAFEFRNESWFTDDVYAALKRRRGIALPFRARGQRAAAAGGDCAMGLRPAAARNVYRTMISGNGRRALEATSWRQIHVYFMHEPTAPAYAKADGVRLGIAPVDGRKECEMSAAGRRHWTMRASPPGRAHSAVRNMQLRAHLQGRRLREDRECRSSPRTNAASSSTARSSTPPAAVSRGMRRIAARERRADRHRRYTQGRHQDSVRHLVAAGTPLPAAGRRSPSSSTGHAAMR